jgi:hypothetical protein
MVAGSLKTVPISRIVQVVKQLINKLSITTSRVAGGTSSSSASTTTESHTSSSSSSSTSVNTNLEQAYKFLSWFQSQLRDIGYLLDEGLSMMQENGVDVTVTLLALQKMVLNGKQQSTGANNEGSKQDTKRSRDDSAGKKGNSPNKKSRREKGEEDANNEDNDNDSDASSDNEEDTLKGEEDPENVDNIKSCLYDMDLVPLIENIIEDVVQCLQTALTKFAQLPARVVLKGILDLHSTDVREAIATMKGNCRYV